MANLERFDNYLVLLVNGHLHGGEGCIGDAIGSFQLLLRSEQNLRTREIEAIR